MIVFDYGSLGPSWQVEHGRLAAVTQIPNDKSIQRLDCAFDARATMRPGAVNAHTHLYSALAPLGMPPPAQKPQTFLEILERIWWRLDCSLDEQSLRASARYGMAQALLSGTTTLVDHHESPNFIENSLEVLADCAQELGIRLVTTYGATERNGGAEEAQRGLNECERFIRKNRRSFVRGLVGLHASFTVSDETIRAAGALASELAVPVHVHVAEDAADVLDAQKRGYPGPLERLLELGALPAGSIVAHGVHLTKAQVQLAQAQGLWLVQNPRSNEGNQVGYPAALHASARVALGTDGWPSDMGEETAALLRLGAAHGESSEVLQPRTQAGQVLAGVLFGRTMGELRERAAADVVVRIPEERPWHVVVGGRRVVVAGELVTADAEEIHRKAAEAAKVLWRRMESSR